jgi:PAS domain S-box-containing protein
MSLKAAGTKTILLVEDEALIAMAEKALLERAGYRVITKSSGKKAVELCLGGEHIDLILMDIDLGSGMDGTEAAKIILEKLDIPVIFLSSHTEPDMVEKTEKITSYGYLVKGCEETVLLASIRMAFHLHDANKRIWEKEERYRILFQTITQGIVHQAGDGTIISANAAAERILGLSSDQMRGKSSFSPRWKMIREDGTTVAGADHPAMVALKTGEVVGPVVRGVFHPEKNKYLWLRITAIPLTVEGEDKPQQVYATFEDISGERSAEHRYRDLINQLPGITYTFSSKRGGLYWSEQVQDILGLSPEASKEDPFLWVRSIHPDDIDNVRQSIGDPSKGSHYLMEYRIRRGDGRWIWLRDRFFRKTEDNEETVIYGFAEDITEYKQTEQVNRAIVEALPDIIYRSDRNGTCLNFYASNSELLIDEKPVGKTVHNILPADLAVRFLDAYEKALKTGRLQTLEYALDLPVGHRYFEARIVPMEDDTLLAVVRDISDEHRANREVEQLVEEKETLLKEIQHRIKNNMNTMTSLLSLQADSLTEPAAIAALKDATGRIRSLELLYDQLYQGDTGVSGSFRDYLEQLVHSVVFLFPRGDEVSLSLDLEDFTADAKKLSTLGLVVNEVVTNAMKYAFRNHPDPKLAIRGRKLPGAYSLTIADNGKGFSGPPESDTSSGFGISMVRTLTDQLHGSIRFEEDQGLKLVLEFPLE